jgi:muramoyltetrapeptide carboxypeptidase LdcA involved in peptidoglycan recycling
MEVLEMMKATEFWPSQNFWKGKIFFLETSEGKPSIHYIDHVLRNYGMLGVYDRINGFIFSRARDYSDEEKKELEEKIVSVIAKEFGKPDLPIVANFDVGHTDPQLVLPLGVKAEINCLTKRIKLTEPWLK